MTNGVTEIGTYRVGSAPSRGPARDHTAVPIEVPFASID
jgi:hypothetical protein